MKLAVMIVGVRGATASTLIATSMAPREGDVTRYLASEAARAAGLEVPAVEEIAWGGWDVRDETWAETVRRHGVLGDDAIARLERVHVYDAVAFERDHAVVASETSATTAHGAAIVARLRDDIRAFRAATGADRIVLVHLGTPAILPERSTWPETADAFLEAIERTAFASAPPYYTAAAIEEGVGVVDYTASPTLEIPGLVALARVRGVPLAGRDGSTGQTLLKSVLAEMFKTRRLRVRGWYSTNILGNHDGLVLQDDRFADTKRIDKTALLEQILEEPVESHIVDIRHYGPAGDVKEAWDAVDFEGWGGLQGSLRINWRACDSLLATPALIDLVRFTALAAAQGRSGLQTQLSAFFKYPLGTDERRYLHLARWLDTHAT